MTRPSRTSSSTIRRIAAVLLASAFSGLAMAQPQESAPAAVPPASAPADASADGELAAVVLEVVGKVRARDGADAEWRALRENDVLRAGAEVQTGLRSHAGIRVGRNATLLLDAGSSCVIPELRQDGQALVTRAAVKSGRADLKVDQVGLDNDFRVVTPSATIAVRGTGLAVQNGKLLGTEVTGSQFNRIAAIEARWVARRLAYYFGHGASTSTFPDPAEGAIDRTVRRRLMPGVVDGRDQLEQAWATGSLQNVVFNLNNLQRLLNLDSSILQDQLAEVAALAQLLEIRVITGELAQRGQGAALLAASFAQKAQQLSVQAAQMIPDIEDDIGMLARKAEYASMGAAAALKNAELEKVTALDARDDAVQFLEETIEALDEENIPKAQEKADAAGLAALLASEAAMYATMAAEDAMKYAAVAANAAASAQSSINQYFAKVGESDKCAGDAAAMAAVAQNAAQASAALQVLAEQLAGAIQNGSAAAILADINANVAAAAQAAASATASRDEALAAASNARSMGERVLFNWAAVYASQAASDAAAAGAAANVAAMAADEAKAAAALAHDLAYGQGKGKGGGD